jgi:hypothetical protein
MQYFAGRKSPPAMPSVIAGLDPAIHLFAKEWMQRKSN